MRGWSEHGAACLIAGEPVCDDADTVRRVRRTVGVAASWRVFQNVPPDRRRSFIRHINDKTCSPVLPVSDIAADPPGGRRARRHRMVHARVNVVRTFHTQQAGAAGRAVGTHTPDHNGRPR
jgi:hypothetical protein